MSNSRAKRLIFILLWCIWKSQTPQKGRFITTKLQVDISPNTVALALVSNLTSTCPTYHFPSDSLKNIFVITLIT